MSGFVHIISVSSFEESQAIESRGSGAARVMRPTTTKHGFGSEESQNWNLRNDSNHLPDRQMFTGYNYYLWLRVSGTLRGMARCTIMFCASNKVTTIK